MSRHLYLTIGERRPDGDRTLMVTSSRAAIRAALRALQEELQVQPPQVVRLRASEEPEEGAGND